jgi:MFS family permease
MGQGVVWYTGQFYAQSFIENVCKVDFDQSRTIIIWAILFATPLFVFFGWLSDKIGRKWIMMLGMLLAVATYNPLFDQLLRSSDVTNAAELRDKEEIQSTIKPIASSTNIFRVTTTKKMYEGGMSVVETKTDSVYASGAIGAKPEIKVSKLLSDAVYWKMVLIVFIMIAYVTMVYGPIAAFLVELFPTKIRYTSMSLPYHIGNGVFGGLTPFIATLLTTIYTGNKLVGLWYPVLIAAVSFFIGLIYISNKIDPDVND